MTAAGASRVTAIVASPALRLALCGAAALYWELVLIRWLSATIRIVAYYQNFVLLAAFFGLGAGALMARYRLRLERCAFPVVAACVVGGLVLGLFAHANPASPDEFVWLGAPQGVDVSSETTGRHTASVTAVLTAAYVMTALAFAVFGQWIGRLFGALPALAAYTWEIGGSLVGIAAFAVLSWLRATPTTWFVVGAALLVLIVDRRPREYLLAAACTVVMVGASLSFVDAHRWSPYYKIRIDPLTSVHDRHGNTYAFDAPIGYTLAVNNDYHQMLLDLREPDRHPMLGEWAALYELPYENLDRLPPGPILVVGAGTGNDVSAALRRTDREVVAVEIDPVILEVGRELHMERPYDDPRVTVVVDDARSFFERTDRRFALVVFGFLDSHAVLSSLSSVRLDNFVYTSESLARVRELMAPGGEVYLTFATATPWLHRRFLGLLDETFGGGTRFAYGEAGYVNGLVYANRRDAEDLPPAGGAGPSALVPTDDWPFLYLRRPVVPAHYLAFVAVVLALGVASLALLPRGERQVRLPFFFLGAGFFLLETSNVVTLSVLFGSTWTVNVLVFSGILVLVLLGNLTCLRFERIQVTPVFVLLVANVLVAYATPAASLLALPEAARLLVAVAVFLGPVYFAALVFATLIRREEKLYQAYGSNVLGAVLGGVCEYLSLMFGFKALLVVTLAFYVLVFVTLRRPERLVRAPAPA